MMVTRHGDFSNNLPKMALGCQAPFLQRGIQKYITLWSTWCRQYNLSCCYYKIININTITITRTLYFFTICILTDNV